MHCFDTFRWTSLFHGQDDETRSSPESLDIQDHKQDNGFCSWIPAFFSIKLVTNGWRVPMTSFEVVDEISL